MVAIELDNLLVNRDGFAVGKESEYLMVEIFDTINLLKSPKDKDDEYHEFWFKLDRGEFDIYRDSFGEDRDETELLNEYHEEYPEAEKWYFFRSTRHNGYAIISINYKICFQLSPDEGQYEYPFVNYYLTEIREIVEDLVKKVKNGEYNDWVRTNLPPQYRYGTIDCDKLLKRDPEFAEYFDELDADDVKEFSDIVKHHGTVDKYIQTMTAEKYKEILSFGYKKTYPRESDGMSPDALYKKYADDRDGGLCEIDQKDPIAFKEWYELDSSTKWDKYGNPTHIWEAINGSSRTRIHVSPIHSDGGWYFVVRCSVYCNREEAVLMFLGIHENGIPVVICDGEIIADILTHNCKIGVIPEFTCAYDFMYGGFPDKDVWIYRNLDDFTDVDFIDNFVDLELRE